jgi:hypothetical protein
MVILVDSDDVSEAGYRPEASEIGVLSPVNRVFIPQARKPGSPAIGLIEDGIRDVNVFDGHRRGVG